MLLVDTCLLWLLFNLACCMQQIRWRILWCDFVQFLRIVINQRVVLSNRWLILNILGMLFQNYACALYCWWLYLQSISSKAVHSLCYNIIGWAWLAWSLFRETVMYTVTINEVLQEQLNKNKLIDYWHCFKFPFILTYQLVINATYHPLIVSLMVLNGYHKWWIVGMYNNSRNGSVLFDSNRLVGVATAVSLFYSIVY